jgi:peptide/nickel transport system permease protein
MMGTMLGATVILETIFSLPGIGRELVGAVLGSDYPMVQGILLFFGVITVFISFIGDLLAYALDRRVKL